MPLETLGFDDKEGRFFGDAIINEFWGGGSKGAELETLGYRAAIVYHYIRYQLLQCE